MSIPLLLVIALLSFAGLSEQNDRSLDDYTPGSCTIFTVANDESVFFCNNEDWRDPDTYYWVIPSDEDGYGVLCFGYENLYPQGGINEKGLAFDANSLPRLPVKANPEGLKPYQAIVNTIIMRECATVQEAIDLARSYDWSQCYGGRLDGQFMLADPTGDAVVIGADLDGEIVFTRRPEGQAFLISTNFNLASPENRFGRYPCNRYRTTERRLRQMDLAGGLSAEQLAPVLEEVSMSGSDLNTLYSNICDLKAGTVHLYYWHRFDRPVTLDVAEIIERRPPPARISTLFPADVVRQAAEEYEGHAKRSRGLRLGALVVLLSILAISVRRLVRRAAHRDQTRTS